MNANHREPVQLNSRKYVIVAVVATFSVWYAQHALAVHSIDVVDSLIYGLAQMVFESLGGLIVFFIGSALLVVLPVAGMVTFCRQRRFYWAALFGFWLGINLINVSILNLSTGNLSALLCDAGFGCLALAGLAAIVFSREPALAPKAAVSPDALAETAYTAPGFSSPQSYSSPLPKASAWALPQSGQAVLAAAALFGLYALYAHGSDWLGALITPGASQDAWPDNYKAAMAQAAAEHKPVLLHFTGSDWCSACQELDRTIINTSAFRDFAAKNLVVVEVDMPHSKFQPADVKEQNSKLVQEFDIQGFPTIIILNRVGKNIGEIVGCPEGEGPSGFIADLQKFIKADRSG